MTGAIIGTRRQTNPDPGADSSPVVRRGVLGAQTEPFDYIDRPEHGLDPCPTAVIEQDLSAGRNEGVRGEGLPGTDGAQDGDPGLDGAVVSQAPADQCEDRTGAKLQNAASAVDEALGDGATKADPTLDLSFLPQQVNVDAHRALIRGDG